MSKRVLSEEQKERQRQYNKKRRMNMSPEERERYLQQMNKRYKAMSPEERKSYNKEQYLKRVMKELAIKEKPSELKRQHILDDCYIKTPKTKNEFCYG